ASPPVKKTPAPGHRRATPRRRDDPTRSAAPPEATTITTAGAEARAATPERATHLSPTPSKHQQRQQTPGALRPTTAGVARDVRSRRPSARVCLATTTGPARSPRGPTQAP